MAADALIKNVAVHALKDTEAGLVRIFAEIEGKLIPLGAEKLGTLENAADAPKGRSTTVKDA